MYGVVPSYQAPLGQLHIRVTEKAETPRVGGEEQNLLPDVMFMLYLLKEASQLKFLHNDLPNTDNTIACSLRKQPFPDTLLDQFICLPAHEGSVGAAIDCQSWLTSRLVHHMWQRWNGVEV